MSYYRDNTPWHGDFTSPKPKKPYVNHARLNSSQGVVRARGFEIVPWEEFFRIYTEAANAWEEQAQLAHQRSLDAYYDNYVKRQEQKAEALQGEAGALEINISEGLAPKNTTPMPGKAAGRRRAGSKAVLEKIESLKFGDWSDKIMPEIITYLGNMQFRVNDNGLLSGKKFVQDNFNTDKDRGLYVFLMLDTRSKYLAQQYRGAGKPYSSLVPLIPYAHRLKTGTPYSAWDPLEIPLVVNRELADGMLYRPAEGQEWPNREQILADRTQCLTFATGKDAGKVRSPLSSFKLYSTQGTCFEDVPHCAQIMMAQIWVAHPENRTKYMVLDPLDWDGVPEPLIPVQMFESKTSSSANTENDLPWM